MPPSEFRKFGWSLKRSYFMHYGSQCEFVKRLKSSIIEILNSFRKFNNLVNIKFLRNSSWVYSFFKCRLQIAKSSNEKAFSVHWFNEGCRAILLHVKLFFILLKFDDFFELIELKQMTRGEMKMVNDWKSLAMFYRCPSHVCVWSSN